MSIERWHDEIRAQKGETESKTFWVSEPRRLDQVPEVQLNYISVKDGDDHGLPPGVYVKTNLTMEGYENSDQLRGLIHTQICLDLLDKKMPPTLSGVPELDLSNTVKGTAIFTNSEGAVVLRIEPLLPSEVDQALRDVEAGRAQGTIVFPKKPKK